MKKSELISAVSEDAGISKNAAGAALDSVFSNISKALSEGGRVSILGFGSFSVSNRPARPGINPQTGAKLEIPARNVAKFTASSKLKDSLN
ncbi:MAG: HU family DNA-binding protein [Flavobacteriaceae bacterium]|nr:HU family DNA-binding protein [Flavobacteriaceae bacterium]